LEVIGVCPAAFVNVADPLTNPTLPKSLAVVGGAVEVGVGVGVRVEVGAGVDVGDRVGIGVDEVTTMPLASVVSLVPVSVAVMMSVVNVPVNCSETKISEEDAVKLELETVPVRSMEPPPAGGTPSKPYSFQYAGSVVQLIGFRYKSMVILLPCCVISSSNVAVTSSMRVVGSDGSIS